MTNSLEARNLNHPLRNKYHYKFLPLSCIEIHKEILSMNNKTCELDHIPTEILKRTLHAIIGTITERGNLSLSTGSFAQDWKTAIVKPLLKKPDWI